MSSSSNRNKSRKKKHHPPLAITSVLHLKASFIPPEAVQNKLSAVSGVPKKFQSSNKNLTTGSKVRPCGTDEDMYQQPMPGPYSGGYHTTPQPQSYQGPVQNAEAHFYQEIGAAPSMGMHPQVADIIRNYPQPPVPLPSAHPLVYGPPQNQKTPVSNPHQSSLDPDNPGNYYPPVNDSDFTAEDVMVDDVRKNDRGEYEIQPKPRPTHAPESSETQSSDANQAQPTSVHPLAHLQGNPNDRNSGLSLLDQYWKFVQENPHDFNGWSYLLNHVESLDNLDASRGVYNAFLPLYPYCYAYWKRYSDLEKKYGYLERALCILERGLEAIPLSVDLWIVYLNLYWEIHRQFPDGEGRMRRQCERALVTAGLEFRSDPLWEAYIGWEKDNGRLRHASAIYRRVIATPTKLFNKHWDSFVEHVREHDPKDILFPEEYEQLKKETCKELGIPYEEEPPVIERNPKTVTQPEERIPALIKEKVVAQALKIHEDNEAEVEKRWKFEDKIKRPYFHIKALDIKQLKAWRDYLEFEMEQGNHKRVVILFERCLIACAHYEEFWCRYARYMELYAEKKAKGLVKDDEDLWISSKEHEKLRAESEENVKQIMSRARDLLNNVQGDATDPIVHDDAGNQSKVLQELSSRELPEAKIDGISSGLSALSKTPLEAIREVYRRACIVHCPKKPMVRLQWAAFEEEQGQVDFARQLIRQVREAYPELVHGKMALVDLERRQNNLETVEEIFKSAIEDTSNKILKSWFSIKHARFCFKILGQPDRALAILRTALKKDRSNFRLYQHVLDVCYQRYPVDVKGFCAAVDLALLSKDLAVHHKVQFAKRKVDFLEEFGNLQQQRKAQDEFQSWCKQCPMDMLSLTAKPILKNRGIQVCLSSPEKEKSREKSEEKTEDKTDEKLEKKKAEDYRNVPPAWNVDSSYGYSTKEPDVVYQEKHHYAEYQETESRGYGMDNLDKISDDDDILDSPRSSKRKRKKRKHWEEEAQSHVRTDDGEVFPKYVAPPKVPSLRAMSPDHEKEKREPIPMDPMGMMAPDPTASPCLNVPDWFVQDGGELVISETATGTSILRYWPRFMTDKGSNKMFRSLRRIVRWHQKKVLVGGQWKPQPRLVAWFGPCDYSYSGLVMEKNDNWPPELLDILHRLIGFTAHEYNSCFLNLYRSGHDSIAWHCDDHRALGKNPPIATVSLGAVRVMEMIKKRGRTNMIRFPLFPGSLLLMEGATQEDWLHQIPKDPKSREERISLVFRIMYAMEDHDKERDEDVRPGSTSPISPPSPATPNHSENVSRPPPPLQQLPPTTGPGFPQYPPSQLPPAPGPGGPYNPGPPPFPPFRQGPCPVIVPGPPHPPTFPRPDFRPNVDMGHPPPPRPGPQLLGPPPFRPYGPPGQPSMPPPRGHPPLSGPGLGRLGPGEVMDHPPGVSPSHRPLYSNVPQAQAGPSPERRFSGPGPGSDIPSLMDMGRGGGTHLPLHDAGGLGRRPQLEPNMGGMRPMNPGQPRGVIERPPMRRLDLGPMVPANPGPGPHGMRPEHIHNRPPLLGIPPSRGPLIP